MDFIDVNTMIGKWALNELSFKTAKGLTAEMDRLNIKKAFVFHSMAAWHAPTLEGGDVLSREIAPYDRLIGAMIMTPLVEIEFGGKEALRSYMAKNRMGAIRLHPGDHNYTLNIWNMEELFEFTESYSVPVFLDMKLIGGDINQLNCVYELARAYKNTPIVLLTVGYRLLRALFKLMEKCPNISIDTSTFITCHGVEDTVKYFGSGRIMFGTRMPFIEGGLSLGRVIYADISEDDKLNIAWRNAEALINNNLLNAQGTGRCCK